MALPTTGKEFRGALRARLEDAERIAKEARANGDDAVARSADQIAAEWRSLLKRAGGK